MGMNLEMQSFINAIGGYAVKSVRCPQESGPQESCTTLSREKVSRVLDNYFALSTAERDEVLRALDFTSGATVSQETLRSSRG